MRTTGLEAAFLPPLRSSSRIGSGVCQNAFEAAERPIDAWMPEQARYEHARRARHDGDGESHEGHESHKGHEGHKPCGFRS